MIRVARALEEAKSVRSRLGKEKAIADGLARFAAEASEADKGLLALFARLAAGQTLPTADGRPLGVGGSLVFDTAIAQTGWGAAVVGAATQRTGDIGEAFALLVCQREREHGKEVARPGLPLCEVAALFETLASSPSRLAKLSALNSAFAKTSWLETKYLAKAILGSLRIGAQHGAVEAAVARAFGVALEKVRRAIALVTDIGIVAELARDGRLDDANVEVLRPVAFMLATPLESIKSALVAARYIAEQKIDGVRAQVHRSTEGNVAIFARGLGRITQVFPEIRDAIRHIEGEFILDGEIVALRPDGKPRPFQALQARLGRREPQDELLAETGVTFVAYDIMFDHGKHLLDHSWTDRRQMLERLANSWSPDLHQKLPLMLNPFFPLAASPPLEEQIETLFTRAREDSYEGLVLKRMDAPYDAGRRGQAWIKIKRAYATLDVVVTAAEEGHGRRAGILSDYTFAVWSDGNLVNVGKAYSGLTDDEIDALSRQFEAATMSQSYGRRIVRPEVVLEVAFDGVQRSDRHDSGYSLRFPRIARIRADKTVHQADSLDAVRALLDAQIAAGHREEAETAKAEEPAQGEKPKGGNASRKRERPNKGAKPKLAKANSRQLDLFAAGAPEATTNKKSDS